MRYEEFTIEGRNAVIEALRSGKPMDKILIQKEKDMVTLLTCHPYRGHGRYRYVVYCMRNHGQKIRKQKEDR